VGALGVLLLAGAPPARFPNGASPAARRRARSSPPCCSSRCLGRRLAGPVSTAREDSSTSLLLVGVMIGSGCSAIVSLILSLADQGQLRGMVFWLLGDLNGAAHWEIAWIALALALASSGRPRGSSTGWRAATPGPRRSACRSHGAACLTLLAAAVATGAAVATAGAIGFVGLVVPHALRLLGVRAAVLLLPRQRAGRRSLRRSRRRGGAHRRRAGAAAGRRARRRDRRAGVHRHAAASPGDAAGRMSAVVAERTTGIALEIAGLRLRAGGGPRGRDLFGTLALRIAGGERWVVIGPNGAGKSSLLAAIAGVFPIAAGQVSIDGRTLADWPAEALAGRRAWSPQFWSDPFPATVRETAVLARERGAWWARSPATNDAFVVDRLLERLDLDRLADLDVRALSGGERQRVAIATALLQGAPLLLLDEPASHLDPAHQRLLLALLADHARAGGAVLASLHDLNLAWDLADHCIVLDGRGGAVAGRRDSVLTAERMSACSRWRSRASRCTGRAASSAGRRSLPAMRPRSPRARGAASRGARRPRASALAWAGRASRWPASRARRRPRSRARRPSSTTPAVSSPGAPSGAHRHLAPSLTELVFRRGGGRQDRRRRREQRPPRRGAIDSAHRRRGADRRRAPARAQARPRRRLAPRQHQSRARAARERGDPPVSSRAAASSTTSSARSSGSAGSSAPRRPRRPAAAALRDRLATLRRRHAAMRRYGVLSGVGEPADDDQRTGRSSAR
jgi:iron complex transport system ATP-binding protein